MRLPHRSPRRRLCIASMSVASTLVLAAADGLRFPDVVDPLAKFSLRLSRELLIAPAQARDGRKNRSEDDDGDHGRGHHRGGGSQGQDGGQVRGGGGGQEQGHKWGDSGGAQPPKPVFSTPPAVFKDSGKKNDFNNFSKKNSDGWPKAEGKDNNYKKSNTVPTFARDDKDKSKGSSSAAGNANHASDGSGGTRSGAGSTSGGGEGEGEDAAPPATVEEFIKSIGKKSAPQVSELPSVDISSRSSDVLVTNADAATLAQAKELGFTAVDSGQFASGQSVTRLVARRGMTRADAQNLLRHQLNLHNLFENHTYKIYAPADAGEYEGLDHAVVPGTRTGQCRDDRCFGRLAIGWNTELSTCARAMKIGIIDTPVDPDHPSLMGRNIKLGSFLGLSVPSALDWHGTAVLALLSGNPQSGVPGLAPEADFYIAQAFRTDADGNASSDTINLLAALDWLDRFDVQLINMSFSGPRDPLIEDAIIRMRKKGVTFVAAAGNNGPVAPESYPAAYKDVIAVTAVNKDMVNYRGANRGSYVDLSAPGVKIWTALPDGKEGFRTGTSFAAPFVTGIVAVSLAGNPHWTSKEELLKGLTIRDLGPPGMDPIYGRGLAVAPQSCSTKARIAKKPAPAAPAAASMFSFGSLTVTPEPAAIGAASAVPTAAFAP